MLQSCLKATGVVTYVLISYKPLTNPKGYAILLAYLRLNVLSKIRGGGRGAFLKEGEKDSSVLTFRVNLMRGPFKVGEWRQSNLKRFLREFSWSNKWWFSKMLVHRKRGWKITTMESQAFDARRDDFVVEVIPVGIPGVYLPPVPPPSFSVVETGKRFVYIRRRGDSSSEDIQAIIIAWVGTLLGPHIFADGNTVFIPVVHVQRI